MNTHTYRFFAHHNFKQIPQITRLIKEPLTEKDPVSQVLPFKSNNTTVDQLINCENVIKSGRVLTF